MMSVRFYCRFLATFLYTENIFLELDCVIKCFARKHDRPLFSGLTTSNCQLELPLLYCPSPQVFTLRTGPSIDRNLEIKTCSFSYLSSDRLVTMVPVTIVPVTIVPVTMVPVTMELLVIELSYPNLETHVASVTRCL